MDYLNGARGLVLDSQPTLFSGTVEENITLGRQAVHFADLQWAARPVELQDEIDRLTRGLESPVEAGGTQLTKSQILRTLVCLHHRDTTALTDFRWNLAQYGTSPAASPPSQTVLEGGILDRDLRDQ